MVLLLVLVSVGPAQAVGRDRMKYSPTCKVVWMVGPRKDLNHTSRSRSLELGFTFIR